VVQSLLDARGQLGGLPFHLADLFEPPYNLGVRVHNNSWGAATGSRYRVSSREVDEFVHTHKDMVIVISAGNEGTTADPVLGARCAAQGHVDWLSVGSPATCKNALTVGAGRSRRTAGGYSQLTYGRPGPATSVIPDEGRARLRRCRTDRRLQQPRSMRRPADQARRGGSGHGHPLLPFGLGATP